MIGLYTNRLNRRDAVPDRTHRIADRERSLAGGVMGPVQARRSLAIVEAPRLVGRGSEAHYRALHPALDPSYGRLRSGSAVSLPHPSVPVRAVRERAGRAIRFGGATALDLVQSVFVPSVYGTARPHVNTARRILVGTVAAFMVLIGATGTGFAGQQPYEARDGETLRTVTETFDVDPEAIRQSIYLPSGDALVSGRTIVIPEAGHLP